jgi:hypothetical protein
MTDRMTTISAQELLEGAAQQVHNAVEELSRCVGILRELGGSVDLEVMQNEGESLQALNITGEFTVDYYKKQEIKTK